MTKVARAKPRTAVSASVNLTPANYRALRLLRDGCAYRIRGAWRFRGLRRRVGDSTLLNLLVRGFAERVETNRHAMVKITPAGRSFNDESERAHAMSVSERMAALRLAGPL